MERTITKQVRLTKEEAKRLRKVARDSGKTESEILRAGIALSSEDVERRERRRLAFEGLKRLADEVPGETIPFRLK